MIFSSALAPKALGRLHWSSSSMTRYKLPGPLVQLFPTLFCTQFPIARLFSRFWSWPRLRFHTGLFATPVRQALKQAGIPESAVGIYVHEIGTPHPLLEFNAGGAMNPASVMKLVTTFAGLELLGPAYTWKTELYADGIRNGDTLQGNLIIKGYGDPKLNLENFWLLTRRLRQTGLREIAGDLVLDNSRLDCPTATRRVSTANPIAPITSFPKRCW